MDSRGALDNTPKGKYMLDNDDEAHNKLSMLATVGHGLEGAVLDVESCLEVYLIGPALE